MFQWESVYAFEHPTGTAVDIIVQTKLFPQSFAKVTCKWVAYVFMYPFKLEFTILQSEKSALNKSLLSYVYKCFIYPFLRHNLEENRHHEKDSSQCFTKLGLETFQLKSRCQESTATRTLLVYDPVIDGLKNKNYTIPVCCSCQITKME